METQLPQFSSIDLEQYKNQLNQLLQKNLQSIDHLLKAKESFSWDDLMQPLDEMENHLQQFWSPLSHLHSVVNSKQLRKCYQECLPLLSEYETTIGHNKALYEAIKSLEHQQLNKTQQKIIKDTVRDFELAGVALEALKKKRFEAIEKKLSKLSNQFENNVLDATQAFTVHITDKKRIKGLPEHALHAAEQLAAEQNLPGYILTLEMPSYIAIMTYAEDRALREEFYNAYVTRASAEGPNANEFDNSDIIFQILKLRQEKAKLLGFKNYAELSIATKMVESTHQVTSFLEDLVTRAHPQAENEFHALSDFAKNKYKLEKLAPWDVAFYSEKKQQDEFEISQEALRAYFPLPKVLSGLLYIVETLYGITLKSIQSADVWHPDVQCFQVLDKDHQIRGFLYMDLFARPNKRSGAWMDAFQSRYQTHAGNVQQPIASLTCNFAKPVANKNATLSHDELLTLFHEFGHCLHHLLTKVNYLAASGINGVEWDAVELPSQFFENWCWDEGALDQLTEHVDSKTPLPHDLFTKLIATKNFQSAMSMMRQLEFSLFDFLIHEHTPTKDAQFISEILSNVRNKTTVTPIAPYNRSQNSFSHIFAGGYAAGYYSYKWAEVLSSDAFDRFEKEGVFNAKTGQDFLHDILEVGSSRTAKEAFEQFRGRPATIDALLRHNGILDYEKNN